MATHKLLIDSRLREAGGTVEEYTIKLFSPIRNVTGFSLQAAVFPKSVYPVLENYNDTFDFDYNSAGPFTAQIASQNYDGFTLASALEAGLNTAASTTDFTVSYDSEQGKLAIVTTTNDHQVLAQTTTPAVQQLLGFSSAGSVAAATLADNVINLSYPHYLLVDMDMLQNQGPGEALWTKHTSHTFPILFGESNFGDIEYVSHENYSASQSVTHDNVLDIRVKIRPPPSSTSNQDAPASFSLNNVDHTLLLALYQHF